MKSIKIVVILIILTISTPTRADMTGAGDAALLTQLVEMVEQGYQQLVKLKDALDISKRMEEYEQLKSVKRLATEGRAIVELYNDMKDFKDEVQYLTNDPFNTTPINKEIDWVSRSMHGAKGNKNAVKAYANILLEMRNLKFLGKAVEKSKNKLASGTNEEDNKQISASSSMIAADILIRNEQRVRQKEANDTSIILRSLKSSYSSMVNDSE